MLVKIIPIIFQSGIILKQILPPTNRLIKVKINAYINSMQTFKTLPLLKVEPRVLKLRKRCKCEKVRKRTWKERKASYLIWIPLTFDKLYILKTLCLQNKLLNGYKRWQQFMWHQPCQCCKYTTAVDIKKIYIKKTIKKLSLMQNHIQVQQVCSRAENSTI